MGKEKIMTVDQYISADSHVLEPANLWLERMDTPFRDRAPRVVHNPPGFEGDYWLFGEREPVTAVQGFFAGASRQSYDEITEHLRTARYAERLPGSYDPVARLKDMDLDGTAAEVLYPTYPLGLMSVTDGLYSANYSASTTTGWRSTAPLRLSGWWALASFLCGTWKWP